MVGPAIPSAVNASNALRRSFRDDVLAGLSRSPKSIPAKHIYDARGSELFEQICELDEYYLTRTERSILERELPGMANAIGRGATVIEPGAGSGEKAVQLLGGLDQPKAFVPIEISHAALADAVELVQRECPDVITQPRCADFTRDADLDLPDNDRRVVFFPGSTIGNFEKPDRINLWKQFAQLVGPEGKVLIGFDFVKSADVLIPAYDDREGVTAEFNTNLLHRINRELEGDIDIEKFEYHAFWNDEIKGVEMGQRSLDDQVITVAGRSFEFRKGERMRTERSHKFTPECMDAEAAQAGFTRADIWTDHKRWFGVGLYQLSVQENEKRHG